MGAAVEEEELQVGGADAKGGEPQVGGGVHMEFNVTRAVLRELEVGDREGAVLVGDGQDLVRPEGVLQGGLYCVVDVVAGDLEGPVAALRRVRAAEPKRVRDAEVAAGRRIAGRR